MSSDNLLRSRVRNTICIPFDPDLSRIADDLPNTSLTLHRLFILVGGACMAVTTLITLGNFLSHLVWRRNLQEQKHLMRLLVLPLIFSIFSWCSIVIYGLYAYLGPIPRLYESYCICTFFHLMAIVLHPSPETRAEFFVQADRARLKKKQWKSVHDRGSWRWYSWNHVVVHMVPLLLLVMTVVEEVVTYRECRTDEGRSTGVAATFQILEVVFTVAPIVSLLRMYSRFQAEFQGTGIMSKFWTVKGLVALYMAQTLVMAIITATESVTATRYMSRADFTYGILPFLICCETLLFAIAQIWTMSALQYRNVVASASRPNSSRGQSRSDASVLRYLFAVVIPTDVLRGTCEALGFLVRIPLGRKRFDYKAGTSVGHKDRRESESGHRLNNGSYEMVLGEEGPSEYRALGRAPM